MPHAELIGYIFGLISVIPAAALTAKYVTLWIGRFHVSYWKALVATAIAYAATIVLGMLLQLSGPISPSVNGARILAGVAILAACNVRFLRSDTVKQLTFIQAVFIAVLQSIGGIAGLFLMLLVALGIKTLIA